MAAILYGNPRAEIVGDAGVRVQRVRSRRRLGEPGGTRMITLRLLGDRPKAQPGPLRCITGAVR